jgi:tryptophan-rich sensory protein
MNWGSLVVFVGFVGATAMLGGQWGADKWYDDLRKPGFTPPKWVFPVAWSILYVMIAVAGWLVWQANDEPRTLALVIWFVQLGLNAAWSYIFFGAKNIGAALFEVAFLWLSIAAFIVVAWPVSQTAALLFVPYLIWVSIAAALNFRIWQMN